MKKLESKLTGNIKKALEEKFGGLWVKVHGSPFQPAGLPDLVGIVGGRFFGLEIKVPGKLNTVTELQSRKIIRINENGGYALVITSVRQALDFVGGILEIVGKPS